MHDHFGWTNKDHPIGSTSKLMNVTVSWNLRVKEQFSRWMIGSMEPPPKRRMKTFPIFEVPVGGTHSVAVVLPEFEAVRDQLAERVRSADGLNLHGNRTVSPVTRLLRMPLGAYLQFVVTHDRRHLWQAHQVRTSPGFGGA